MMTRRMKLASDIAELNTAEHHMQCGRRRLPQQLTCDQTEHHCYSAPLSIHGIAYSYNHDQDGAQAIDPRLSFWLPAR